MTKYLLLHGLHVALLLLVPLRNRAVGLALAAAAGALTIQCSEWLI